VAAVIVTEGVSGDIFDASIAHAICTSNRSVARPFIILLCLLCMRNPMAVTIEGRGNYVKKKKFYAVVVKYTKYNLGLKDAKF
jgi:hypothetical protein